MDKLKKEIRNLMTGLLAVDPDSGRLMAARSFGELGGGELFPGADAVRILGLYSTKRKYAVEKRTEQAWQECTALLTSYTPVLLNCAPDTLAMLHRPFWGKPSLITLDREGKEIVLRTYTARTPLCRLRTKRLMKGLEQELPAGLREEIPFKQGESGEKKKSAFRKREKKQGE